MTATTLGELAGYTVGITAARRREELGAALERLQAGAGGTLKLRRRFCRRSFR